jgi:very-short-patch-repair endonuclease
MSSKLFLQSLQSKLKGGNAKSIHLNALPGRFATRLDLKNFDLVGNGLSEEFIRCILTKASFEFKISFDNIDLNTISTDTQKKLAVLSKRLNSIIIENDDYFKEHGRKTLCFGYPILIKRSSNDPNKVIKAPLFIWPLEAIKSKNKVNEWCFLRNKDYGQNGKLIDSDIHSISVNEILISFIKGEDNITLPNLTPEVLEDSIIDEEELIEICSATLHSLNSGSKSEYKELLQKNFQNPVEMLPDGSEIDKIANNKAYIHFGGIFGLFKSQKESIITDISKLLERFEEFKFDSLQIDNTSTTGFSAVSTDPSQQSIITSISREYNQIIQGPPGTGKSQSLTALIINALANGHKCLVVCEKKTALDVIKQNVSRINQQIGTLVAVIDDVNDDREAIVDSVRDRQSNLSSSASVQQISSSYNNTQEALQASALQVNSQHRALDEIVHQNKKWTECVGRFLNLKRKYAELPLRDILNKADFSFNETELLILLPKLNKAEDLFSKAAKLNIFDEVRAELFNLSVGEARVKIEQFTANILTLAPKLKEELSLHIENSKRWELEYYSTIHQTLQVEIRPFTHVVKGESLSQVTLPSTFPLEKQLSTAVESMSEILTKAKELKNKYVYELTSFYQNYDSQLKNGLSQYLSFVENSIDSFGQTFLKNDFSTKLKIDILSIVSSHHKRLKASKIELLAQIPKIKHIHQSKKFILHEYNDDREFANMNTYVENIRELSVKAEAWSKLYAADIEKLANDIRDENIDEDFLAIKTDLRTLINRFNILTNNLAALNIIEQIQVTDLNALINVCPKLLQQISRYIQQYADFRRKYQETGKYHIEVKNQLFTLETCNNQGSILKEEFPNFDKITDVMSFCDSIIKKAELLKNNLTEFRNYYEWKSLILSLSSNEQRLITTLSENNVTTWSESFECWYLFWILSLNEPQNLPRGDYELKQYKTLKAQFDQAQINKIISRWQQSQTASVSTFKAKGLIINSLYNKKGAKGTRRNSLRNIVKSDFNLFTDFFPVLLLNPSVCSSIIPLEEGIFDLVIFDEASQLRLEDTYAALIRGKAKVVSGDKHQMAPSSYFEGGGALLEPFDDDVDELEEELIEKNTAVNLADSESLLAYADNKGFKQLYLDIHYRSQHPYLIDFSNSAFYGERLIPIPMKINYTPIEYLQVNGTYNEQTNIAEAAAVIELIQHKIFPTEDGNYPSVGVATFNIYQRNLILEEIGKKRQENPDFDILMSKLGSSFFVKNLENIQGDERDVIIISTTFGRKKDGTFTQNFGPIIQAKGHRMLNVIITRAKYKIFICTSFPSDIMSQYTPLLQKNGNKGRGILYAYLNYAKAVSENNVDARVTILNTVSQYCTEKHFNVHKFDGVSESIFEDEVYDRLAEHVTPDRIVQQYKLGGFRIDIAILDKDLKKPIIAIECDGAKYHSSDEAYAWDIFRQEQLERHGLMFHRIWSTNWWDAPDKELTRLVEFIKLND